MRRNWLFCAAAAAALLLLPAFSLPAQTSSSRATQKTTAPGTPTTGPADYRSQHFYIHTDLSPADAKELLERLEVMIKGMSNYWGRPPTGIIECYVVEDLTKWPDNALGPGLAQVQAGAGVTIMNKLTSPTSKQFVAKSTVYAVADRGTPQHEAVHAYCGQTFGTTGPLWYSEGMAEMGNYWHNGEKGVSCRQEVADYIRETPAKTVHDIVNAEEFTGDSWQNYAWRWALCHVLDQNPNYQVDFRKIGLAFLYEKPVTFEQVFGPRADQIQFEYHFFLKHVNLGYRVDLCSWDWERKFRPMIGTGTTTARIMAGKGWQPTSAELTAATEYQYSATGTWQTGKEAKPINADGAEDGGNGRLVGILMKDYTLSEPFELGSYGTFTAPSDGKLYLRCQDAWNEIADNKGTLTIKLKLKSATALPKPRN